MSGLLNNSLFLSTAAAAGGYQIERSLRFNSSDSAYASRTPGTASNRKTWTWSGWVKRGALGTTQVLFFAGVHTTFTDSAQINLQFTSGDKLRLETGATALRVTTQVFRDPSAWYHIVLQVDTTQSSASNQFKLYINGTQITTFDTLNGVIQNTDLAINNNVAHNIGAVAAANANYLSAYLADIHFIDGQALDATAFTEVSATTGQLIPKTYTGTFGTNGFWLKFSDNSSNTAATLGKDYSGNSNNWTPNNLSTTTGGPTSVAAASGALPVFNTTDTYGTVKGTGTRTDTNSASIVLALPMDGTNGGTSFGDQSAVIRGSGSAKTVTVNGNTNTSTAQSKFYGSSGYFDGTGDWLETPHSADFTLSRSASTMECWVYPTNLSSQRIVLDKTNSGATNQSYTVRINTNGTVLVEWIYPGGGSSASLTSALTVSTNIWSHISVVTSSNTLYVYVDGIRDANTTALSNDAQSTTSTPFRIGSTYNSSNQFLGYIQDVRVYTTAKYTGNFNPPSSTANATIAAGNDSLVDTPTSIPATDTGVGGEVRGNYCTANPLNVITANGVSISNGNLDISLANATTWGTLAIPQTGKWYFEVTINRLYPISGGGYGGLLGIAKVNTSNWSGVLSQTGVDTAGGIYKNGAKVQVLYAGTVGDVYGIAFNADSLSLQIYINGATHGSAITLDASEYVPFFQGNGGGLYDANQQSLNFGQRAFAYPLSGFKALCDTNLPAPLTAKPNTLMDVALWTGTGATNAITGLGFSPDLVWIKKRSAAADHNLVDSVRVGTRPYLLYPNLTNAENTSYTLGVQSLDSAGFTLGTDGDINGSGATYAGWCWDAGTSTVTNTAGSITSQVRANVSAGFSVVTYPGNGSSTATFGHGLGVTPGFFIIKNRSSSCNWMGYHSATGKDAYYDFNTTNAVQTTIPNIWGTSGPSSSLITVTGAYLLNNQSGQNYVCYAWSPVSGYSSFGSYTGNGSTSGDGPFIYTGHRSRFVLIKRTDSGDSQSDWVILDTARDSYNTSGLVLRPNLSNAEVDDRVVGSGYISADILSNGFKLKGSSARINASSGTYIYAAFAENPFQYARAR